MYAVIRNGGKQYRVMPGQILKLEKISAEAGEIVKFEEVLLINDGDQSHTGSPLLANAVVTGEVVKHGRASKIRIIKMKRRKHHIKHQGHRQHYTAIKFTAIDVNAKK